jgi:hypothetical protein
MGAVFAGSLTRPIAAILSAMSGGICAADGVQAKIPTLARAARAIHGWGICGMVSLPYIH